MFSRLENVRSRSVRRMRQRPARSASRTKLSLHQTEKSARVYSTYSLFCGEVSRSILIHVAPAHRDLWFQVRAHCQSHSALFDRDSERKRPELFRCGCDGSGVGGIWRLPARRQSLLASESRNRYVVVSFLRLYCKFSRLNMWNLIAPPSHKNNNLKYLTFFQNFTNLLYIHLKNFT